MFYKAEKGKSERKHRWYVPLKFEYFINWRRVDQVRRMEGCFFPYNSASSFKDGCRSTGKEHVDSFQGDQGIQSSCRGWETVEMSRGLRQPQQRSGIQDSKLLQRAFPETCQGTEEFIMTRKVTEMGDTCTGAKTCLKRIWTENATSFLLYLM